MNLRANAGLGITMNAPVSSARSGAVRGQVGMRGNPYKAGGKQIVRNREFLQDIIGSNAGFAMPYYGQVNAGHLAGAPGTTDQAWFPWLSGVASNYQKYRFRSLRYVIEPQCSTATTGSVLMAWETDISDVVPDEKIQMMTLKTCVRCAPWERCTLSVPCGGPPLRCEKNVPTGYAASPGVGIDDPFTGYNMGRILVAVQGQTNADTISELYVEYEVELFEPISESLQTGAITVSSNSSVSFFTEENVSSASNFFDSTRVTLTAWTAADPPTFSGNTISLNTLGIYTISGIFNATAGDNVTFSAPTYTGCGDYGPSPVWSSPANDVLFAITVEVTATPGQVQLNVSSPGNVWMVPCTVTYVGLPPAMDKISAQFLRLARRFGLLGTQRAEPEADDFDEVSVRQLIRVPKAPSTLKVRKA